MNNKAKVSNILRLLKIRKTIKILEKKTDTKFKKIFSSVNQIQSFYIFNSGPRPRGRFALLRRPATAAAEQRPQPGGAAAAEWSADQWREEGEGGEQVAADEEE